MATHVIDRIVSGSIAEELGIESGDTLVSVNGESVCDIFDYHYLCNEEYLTVEIRKKNGEEIQCDIEKEYEEDIGIEFENGLMDEYKSCNNHCVFCFIDQMPQGMRETLYFKDDDSRLSFLQGNYVTLTNMSEDDVNRIIKYKMGPINISVQTMNPKLRVRMLKNKYAGEALKKIDQFYEAGIPINGQVVLCKGMNDGKELDYTIRKLMAYMPVMESLSIVPVGLSKFRKGLQFLEPFTKQDAIAFLEMVHKYQAIAMEKYHTHFVHASDEWYLLAEQELPNEENYDGYSQLENGVGMLRLLIEEAKEEISQIKGPKKIFSKEKLRTVTIATGALPAPILQEIANQVCAKREQLTVNVLAIRNDFFGEMITVSGLITGQDLIKQLKERDNGDEILIPTNMLRTGEEVFLDDVTLSEVRAAINVPITVVDSSGQDLVKAILG